MLIGASWIRNFFEFPAVPGRVVHKGRGIEILIEPLRFATRAHAERLSRHLIGAILILVEGGVVIAVSTVDGKGRPIGRCTARRFPSRPGSCVAAPHDRVVQERSR